MVSDEFKEKQKTPELVEGEAADAVQKSKSKPVSFAHSFCLHGLLSYILGLVILIATFANELFGRPIALLGLMSIVAGMGALAIALVYLCVAAIVGGADHRPGKAKTVLVSLLPICVLAVVMTLVPPQLKILYSGTGNLQLSCGLVGLLITSIFGSLLMLKTTTLRFWVLFAGLFVLPWPPVIVAAAMIGYALIQFQKAL